MSVKVTNEYYPEYDEHEKYVSGDHSSASIYDDHACLTIGGMPDLSLSGERLVDLRDVLNAAVDLMYPLEMVK